MGGQNGLWGMGDHTRPIGAFDLMMRVPLVWRQPGRIQAGKTSDALVSNYDFLPSLLNYLGMVDKLPAKPKLAGRDYSPLLAGREIAWENTVYYEMENTRAIRTDALKYVARRPDGPFELYDLAADPAERFNLFGQPKQAGQQVELAERLNRFFAEFADPQYDLWRGGRTKAGRLEK
jgi:arylsulfatase A-like enzyme